MKHIYIIAYMYMYVYMYTHIYSIIAYLRDRDGWIPL